MDACLPATMLASDTDPWMSAHSAAAWARRWACGVINLGDVGHINVDSGFGPLPAAKNLTEFLMRRVEQRRRVSRAPASEARPAP